MTRAAGVRPCGNRCKGGGCRREGSEELLVAAGVGVARRGSWGRPVGEALARERVSPVAAAGDVHHLKIELGECVQPTRLVVADRALPLQPHNGLVVGVQFEVMRLAGGPRPPLGQQVVAEGAERVDHCKELQHVRRVRALSGRELPRFESNGQGIACIVGLGQNGGDGQLGRIRGEDRLAVAVPHAKDGR